MVISTNPPPVVSLTVQTAQPLAVELPVEPIDLNALLDADRIQTLLRSDDFPIALTLEKDPNLEMVWGHNQLSEMVSLLVQHARTALQYHPQPRASLQTKAFDFREAELASLRVIAPQGPIGSGRYMRLRVHTMRYSPQPSASLDLTRLSQLLQAAGGFISVPSISTGIALDVYLPKAFGQEVPLHAAAIPEFQFTREILRGPVLIVDNEPMLIRVTESGLTQRMGFETVLSAPSIQEALTIIEERRDIRVVLADEGLTGEKGSDLLLRLKLSHPEIETALYTGDSVEHFRGFSGTLGTPLSKPFNMEALAATLYRLSRRSIERNPIIL